MLGYVTIGTNDVEKAAPFYDAVLGKLGAKRVRSSDRGIVYGETGMEVLLVRPFNGEAASPGNGPMTALKAPTRAMVDEVYALALGLGGSDEGAPGTRGRESSNFYGAYFRDPEGNKLCVFRMGSD